MLLLGLKRPACNFLLDPYQKVGISSPSSLPSAPCGRISCKCSALPPLLTPPPPPPPPPPPLQLLQKLTLAHTPLSYSDAAGNETSPTIPLHNHQPRAARTGCSLTQTSHPEILSISAQRELLHYPRTSLLLPSIEQLPQKQPPPTFNRAAPSAEVPRNSSLPSRYRAAPPEADSSLPLSSSPAQRDSSLPLRSARISSLLRPHSCCSAHGRGSSPATLHQPSPSVALLTSPAQGEVPIDTDSSRLWVYRADSRSGRSPETSASPPAIELLPQK